jgi:hypothetical protein
MPDKCPVCGEKYEREIGFYYGAMYVNYALTVAAGVAWFILVYFFYGFDPMVFSVSFTILLVLLIPWMFRTGRLTWISFFVKYDKNANKNKADNKASSVEVFPNS